MSNTIGRGPGNHSPPVQGVDPAQGAHPQANNPPAPQTHHVGHFKNSVFRLGTGIPDPPFPQTPLAQLKRRRPPTGHPQDDDYGNPHAGLPLNPASTSQRKRRRAATGLSQSEDHEWDANAVLNQPQEEVGTQKLSDSAGTGDQEGHGSHNFGQNPNGSRSSLARALIQSELLLQQLETQLKQTCGPPAQSLLSGAAKDQLPDSQGGPAQVLTGTLLAAMHQAHADKVARSVEALHLTAVRAYLKLDVDPDPLVTLPGVKQALLHPAHVRFFPQPPVLPASEKEQNARLLLPLKLLNAARPRTPLQRQLACARLELIATAQNMQSKKS